MEDQPNFVTSPFDALRHLDGEREYWLAREVSKVLGYVKWDKFEGVIAKAKIACKYNGHPVEQEFHETTKQRKVGARGGRTDIRDIELTRYACYMIVLDADSSKPIVSHAKDYFAEQTRRQELADADTFAQLSEDEKRLVYRAQLSLYNRKLAQTAHEAGVVTQSEHADFANSGYKGLYNELTENDIHALKHLAPSEEISNWMGSEELADNIFRAAQTDATMKREKPLTKSRPTLPTTGSHGKCESSSSPNWGTPRQSNCPLPRKAPGNSREKKRNAQSKLGNFSFHSLRPNRKRVQATKPGRHFSSRTGNPGQGPLFCLRS